ncbi:hypothetical protein ACP2AV_13715 [Aliiroseovarius sp. PTFE2010]|uniref:hypothetical protein n=1 Tax=Aliiroseovarius sp. PTFE2010 TaxID=3417190 RepID=UPI003CF4A170
MKHPLMMAALASVIATAAHAGTIERACLTSDRSASRALCGCIQQVADQTLSTGDQRMAARFFKDPQKAQDIRQSDNRSHEVFWKRYKAFGAVAQDYCS